MGSSGEDEGGWLNWFHEQPVHRWMCRVDASFLEDAFNLYGLADELAAAGASDPRAITSPAAAWRLAARFL